MELLVFASSGAERPAEEYRLEDPERVVLGRGPQSPVPLDGPAVSREHLTLEVRGGALWATDVSSNGSYFNGRALTPGAPQLIGPSDELRVGEHLLRFRVVADEPPPTEETPAPQPPQQDAPPAATPKIPAAAPTAGSGGLLSGITFTEWLALIVLLAVGGLIAVWWLR